VGGFSAAYHADAILGSVAPPEAAASKVSIAEGSGPGKIVGFSALELQAWWGLGWELQKDGYTRHDLGGS